MDRARHHKNGNTKRDKSNRCCRRQSKCAAERYAERGEDGGHLPKTQPSITRGNPIS